MRGRKKEMQIPSPLPFFSSTPPPQGDLRVKICALPRNSVKIETNETEEDLGQACTLGAISGSGGKFDKFI